jgi:hypothetical protein
MYSLRIVEAFYFVKLYPNKYKLFSPLLFHLYDTSVKSDLLGLYLQLTHKMHVGVKEAPKNSIWLTWDIMLGKMIHRHMKCWILEIFSMIISLRLRKLTSKRDFSKNVRHSVNIYVYVNIWYFVNMFTLRLCSNSGNVPISQYEMLVLEGNWHRSNFLQNDENFVIWSLFLPSLWIFSDPYKNKKRITK